MHDTPGGSITQTARHNTAAAPWKVALNMLMAYTYIIRYGVAVTFSPLTAEPRVRLPVSEPIF